MVLPTSCRYPEPNEIGVELIAEKVQEGGAKVIDPPAQLEPVQLAVGPLLKGGEDVGKVAGKKGDIKMDLKNKEFHPILVCS